MADNGQPRDAVIIRFVLEHKEDNEKQAHNNSKSFKQVFSSLSEQLNFNYTAGNYFQRKMEEKTNSLQSSLGRRTMNELRFERYTSQSSSIGSDEVLTLKELPDSIPFYSGIPAVEVTNGIVHLFRDRSKSIEERHSEVLCVLGVPAHIQLSDFLRFISLSLSTLLTIQVVRDSTPNQYMVLLTFKNKSLASTFYSTYNLRRYSSMEKGVCQLVYATRIEVVSSLAALAETTPPSEGITELPSCPVCLEKLDESVLTILCNHSFHTDCITRWDDSTCPVCRYTQIPEQSSENTCSMCDSKENLWICLVCGNVGCGRYHGGHAHEHFVTTQHTFSMQVGTQRVWDYVGDNYVHRLVQNKEDGKLVEVSGNSEIQDEEKIDSLQLEYTYLLTSQLESQRLFFEEKLARAEQETTEQVKVLEVRCKATVAEKEKCEEKFEEEKRERDKRYQQLQAKLSKVHNELSEEKELNKCLTDNQKVFRERFTALEEQMHSSLKEKDKEIHELQEQLKDLMFALDVQQKISVSSPERQQELREGHMTVSSSQETKRGSGGGRSRRGRHS